jgi:hypothetical protein
MQPFTGWNPLSLHPHWEESLPKNLRSEKSNEERYNCTGHGDLGIMSSVSCIEETALYPLLGVEGRFPREA